MKKLRTVLFYMVVCVSVCVVLLLIVDELLKAHYAQITAGWGESANPEDEKLTKTFIQVTAGILIVLNLIMLFLFYKAWKRRFNKLEAGIDRTPEQETKFINSPMCLELKQSEKKSKKWFSIFVYIFTFLDVLFALITSEIFGVVMVLNGLLLIFLVVNSCIIAFADIHNSSSGKKCCTKCGVPYELLESKFIRMKKYTKEKEGISNLESYETIVGQKTWYDDTRQKTITTYTIEGTFYIYHNIGKCPDCGDSYKWEEKKDSQVPDIVEKADNVPTIIAKDNATVIIEAKKELTSMIFCQYCGGKNTKDSTECKHCSGKLNE